MIKFFRFSARTLGLSYVVVSLVVLVSFATPLWYIWCKQTVEDRIELLQGKTQWFETVFNLQGLEGLASIIDKQVGSQTADAEELILLADASFSRLAGNLSAWPSGVPALPGKYTLSIEVDNRLKRMGFLRTTLPGGYHLLVANDIAKYRTLEIFFLYGLIFSASIVLLLGMLGGLLVRRTLLSKVKDINQAASAIMRGNFSHRLPDHGGENELNTLVETQNRMLDQIEHLIGGIRNVSNAIAHDLRTPLAELRSRLEELSLTRPDPEYTFAEVDNAMTDVDRVINIFNAIMRLAEIDTGTRRSGFIKVDVANIASEVAEFYQPVAELQGRALTCTSLAPLMLVGDPVLLAQAIGNLIENALKYAQENGGIITVEARSHPDGMIEIAVSDDGPGIPEEEKTKVLERFYRGDASRGTPGAGLGLSLVAAVAKLHGGILKLIDNHPGLRATLTLFPSANSISEVAAHIETENPCHRRIAQISA